MEFIEDLKKRSALTEALIEIMMEIGPRKAENRLMKTAKKLMDTIADGTITHEVTDNLSDEQLDAITAYLEMVMAGFNTFMEQFKSTIEKENPHSSGN